MISDFLIACPSIFCKSTHAILFAVHIASYVVNYTCVYILSGRPLPSNSGSNLDNTAIIGGAVGGVILLLLMIPVVLCVVVLCLRRRNRKRTHPDEEEHIYETLVYDNRNASNHMHNKCRAIGNQQSHFRSTNPSRSVNTEYGATSTSDSRKYQSSDSDTTREYDYPYAENRPHSHHSTSASSAMNDYTISVDQSVRLPHAAIGSPPNKESNYGVVNQIMSDCLDDGTTSDSDSSAANLSII